MPINITDNGLLLESPIKMVGLPAQAFAVTLNDMDIEDMIERVKNGEGIELSLGPNPVSRTPRIGALVALELPIVLLHNYTIASIGEALYYCVLVLKHQRNKTRSSSCSKFSYFSVQSLFL